MRMQGKVAIVTGAASGIGREIARAFAREGAKVWIADLTLEAAQAAAAEIENEGGAAKALAVNVTDPTQVDAGVNEVVEHHGAIDVLVSNAGIQHIEPIIELSLENTLMAVSC
jgi:3-hydroxybutyrate dehydrogenase